MEIDNTEVVTQGGAGFFGLSTAVYPHGAIVRCWVIQRRWEIHNAESVSGLLCAGTREVGQSRRDSAFKAVVKRSSTEKLSSRCFFT